MKHLLSESESEGFYGGLKVDQRPIITKPKGETKCIVGAYWFVSIDDTIPLSFDNRWTMHGIPGESPT